MSLVIQLVSCSQYHSVSAVMRRLRSDDCRGRRVYAQEERSIQVCARFPKKYSRIVRISSRITVFISIAFVLNVNYATIVQ